MEKNEAQNELLKLDQEITRRLKQEKYRFYEPSVKGEEFTTKVATPGNFITLWSAANGIGKTATGSNLIANLLWPSDNPYFQYDLFHNWPFPKAGRIASDPTNIEKNIIPQLEFWFPDQVLGKYKARKANKSYLSEFKTDTGFSFDVMSYEQDPMEFEGVTLGWCWLDEPPPYAVLKAVISRMRKGGIIFITATPLAGSAYLYDMFARGKTDVEFEGPEGTKISYKRNVSYVEADVWSACREIEGTRGHLTKQDIYNMIAEYDEDEKQARIFGKFQHLVGVVFKQFSHQFHVIKPFPINSRDYCVWELLDPHPRNPDAVLWVAIDKNGTKFIVDELYENVQDTSELAFRIKQKAQQFRVVRRIADPSAFVNNQHDLDGKSLAQRLATDYGLTYESGPKQRSMADKRIQDALSYREANGHMIVAPEVYFFEGCKRTTWEMENYRWDEWTGRAADKKDRKEKPIDKDDHMVENLGRCLYLEPQFQEKLVYRSTGNSSSRDELDPFF